MSNGKDTWGNNLRRLRKGKQDSAATAKLTGQPAGNEGQNGDIQIRMTDRGPRLFAKLGNKWRIAVLRDEEEPGKSVKMHTFSGVMTAGATSNDIPLPSWIRSSSVAGVMFFAGHSADLWHIYEWRSDAGTQSAVKHRVFYDRGQHRIEVRNMGTQIDDGKPYKVIVFYT